MKDDEAIIKALEHCADSADNIQKCQDCPLFGDYAHCRENLIVGANDLVRRLLGRNERLKRANKKLKENA